MPEQQGLSAFAETLRRQWLLALGVALPLMAGALLYVESLPAQYDGRSVVSFAPRPDADTSADVLRLLLSKYQVYVRSDRVVSRVAGQLDTARSPIADGLGVAVPSDTSNLEITVRHEAPRLAADAANALAREAALLSEQDPLIAGEVVVEAVVPGVPAAPPRRLLEAAGFVAALVAGAGAALLAERLRPRVRTLADIGRETHFRVVGRLPATRVVRTAGIDALSDPVIGAGIRSLRTMLERESRDNPAKTVVITSVTAGEGKTTVATLFATALARLQAEVLLIDADLHRPGVSRALGVADSPGLREVLRDGTSFAGVIRPAPAASLSVLPTTADAEAGDLLARRFGHLLGSVRDSYDVVIVDAPPMLGNDSSRTLATMADAVLLVVSSGTPIAAVREASSALQALQVRVLGVVANRAQDSGAYVYYGAEH